RPGFSSRPAGAAFFEEGAEGRDAGAGSDQDDRGLRISRQAETVRGLDENGNHPAGLNAIREKRGTHALAAAAVGFVSHRANRKMDFSGMRFRGGGDRIKAGLKFAEERDEFLWRKFHAAGFQKIN